MQKETYDHILAKYKVGNYIRIKELNPKLADGESCESNQPSAGYWYTSEMEENYGGRIARIISIHYEPSEKDSKVSIPIYILDIDDGNYYWEEYMFEERIGGGDKTIIKFENLYLIHDRDAKKCLPEFFNSEPDALIRLSGK